jgi:uncharacterized RDD family membrane protein YckC
VEATAPVTRDTVCAGFGDRFVAWLIDFAILLIPNIIIYVVFKGEAIGQLISLVVNAGYVVYFWSSSGQTPGKSVMKLKVVHADGGGILTPGQAIVRWIGTFISSIPLGLGYLWIIWDPKHEAWQDKIATTKVIKVG